MHDGNVDACRQMEILIQEKTTQKENELNATYDEKMMNYEERCVYPPTSEFSAFLCTTAIAGNVTYNGSLDRKSVV